MAKTTPAFMLAQLQAVLDVMSAVNRDDGSEAGNDQLYGDLSRAVQAAAERTWPGVGRRAYERVVDTSDSLLDAIEFVHRGNEYRARAEAEEAAHWERIEAELS